MKIGTGIYNRGDMANQPHTGTIIAITGSEWGTYVTIETDPIKCEYSGDTPSYTYTTPLMNVHTVSQGNGHTRIVTERAEAEFIQRQHDERLAHRAALVAAQG
tara:strand:- start:6315 stop:6623 length:309 start_codon:yes stop_codon:yes gene_type:complete